MLAQGWVRIWKDVASDKIRQHADGDGVSADGNGQKLREYGNEADHSDSSGYQRKEGYGPDFATTTTIARPLRLGAFLCVQRQWRLRVCP